MMLLFYKYSKVFLCSAIILGLFVISIAVLSISTTSLSFQEEGIASWYGPDFAGKKTAMGNSYDPSSFTAAHRTLPLGSLIRVRNVDTGSSVVVIVDDRGPYAEDRIIDLSHAAAGAIGLLIYGIERVQIEGLRLLK